MIDIDKTISLRGYDPLMLKPKSNKKVWCICNECEKERWLMYTDYNDLCRVCAINRAFGIYKPEYFVAEEDRFISGTGIDRIKTIEEKGYDPINLSEESNKDVWAICKRCDVGRWLPYQAYTDLCFGCCKMAPVPQFVSEKDRFIPGTGIDRITTIEEKGYDPINLKSQAQRKVWCVCLDCKDGRWLSRVDYHDLCFDCVQGVPSKAKLLPKEQDRFIPETGIDRIKTIQETGYDPIDLAQYSNKKIWCVCLKCGNGRWLSMDSYYDLCSHCGNSRSGEDNPFYGRHHTDETKLVLSKTASGKTGDKASNWQGGASFDPYCPKFNGKLKQQIRDRYGNCDFISGLLDSVCNVINNKVYKLDVHHIDSNKMQGCNGIEWKLIPLSRKNHMRMNRDSVFWERLICYALEYDETYYNDEIKDIFAN